MIIALIYQIHKISSHSEAKDFEALEQAVADAIVEADVWTNPRRQIPSVIKKKKLHDLFGERCFTLTKKHPFVWGDGFFVVQTDKSKSSYLFVYIPVAFTTEERLFEKQLLNMSRLCIKKKTLTRKAFRHGKCYRRVCAQKVWGFGVDTLFCLSHGFLKTKKEIQQHEGKV